MWFLTLPSQQHIPKDTKATTCDMPICSRFINDN